MEPEIIIKCGCCADVITEDNASNSVDGFICESCRDNDYFYCELCKKIHHNDNLIYVNDNYFCSRRCANAKDWYECKDCNSWIYSDDSFNDDNGNLICESCYDNNYCSCENCSETVHNDNSHYDSRRGYSYCESCWEGEEDDHVIKSYSYKPSEYVYSKMCWENTMYLGIELEVECGSDRAEDKALLVTEWLARHGHGEKVYIKKDSSLSNGFEIVFHPITLQALHKKFPMKAFLTYLQSLKLTSHKTGSCGLHVHLSRGKMKEKDVYKGKIFFFKCEEYLKKFGARRDNKSSMNDEDIFNFCKFDKYMPLNGTEQEYGRYHALNSCNSKTLEIRLFRGCLVYERFQASLQFSDCFGEYIQKIGMSEFNKANHLIWKNFIDFAKRSNKYSQFIKYVIKKGII